MYGEVVECIGRWLGVWGGGWVYGEVVGCIGRWLSVWVGKEICVAISKLCIVVELVCILSYCGSSCQ